MKHYKIGNSQNLKTIHGRSARFFNYQEIIKACYAGEGVLSHKAERVLIFQNTSNKVTIAAVITMDVVVEYTSHKSQMCRSWIETSLKEIKNIEPKFYIKGPSGEPEEVTVSFGKGAINIDFDQYLDTGEWTRKIALDISELETMLHRAQRNQGKKDRYPLHHTGYLQQWKKSLENKQLVA